MKTTYSDLSILVKQPDTDAICFTSNGIVKNNGNLVMGAGNAKWVRDNIMVLINILAN